MPGTRAIVVDPAANYRHESEGSFAEPVWWRHAELCERSGDPVSRARILASQWSWIGSRHCSAPIPAAASDDALMKESLAMLERHNIFAVTTGPLAHVKSVAGRCPPTRIIPAHAFGDPGFTERRRVPEPDHETRAGAVRGGVTSVRKGCALDDSRDGSPISRSRKSSTSPSASISGRAHLVRPYWAAPGYRARLTDPYATGRSVDSPPQTSAVCHALRVTAH